VKPDRFLDDLQRTRAANKAEADGRVADNIDVRMELVRKMHSGEMTLDEVQAELKRIKRDAKKNGKVTRQQAYRGY
jgi:hypothetical protein